MIASRFRAAVIAAVAFVGMSANSASAASQVAFECTLVVDAVSGATLHESGICDRRISPASTFKVPLAVMGYDAGILVDAETPAWDYRAEFKAVERDRKTVDPTIWERDSVLWYSREIVRYLGRERFEAYVAEFDYGNADISGTPGRNDALTMSWVASSLAISPIEQVRFVRLLLAHELPASRDAIDRTRAIMPAFTAGGWQVKGKTGSARLRDSAGAMDSNRPFGWFVGWAQSDGRTIAFARLRIGTAPAAGPMGPETRALFLEELPTLPLGGR